MVLFDWLLLLVVAISMLISLIRGFIREAFSLAGWILAFFVAKWFYLELAVLLEGHFTTPSLRMGISWAALFFATLAVSGLVNFLLSQFIERSGLSGMDRMMGMAFGAARGVLVAALLVISLQTFTHVQQDSWWQRSYLVPHFETFGRWFYAHLKESIPGMADKVDLSQ